MEKHNYEEIATMTEKYEMVKRELAAAIESLAQKRIAESP